jgi:predicted transposase YdaD
VDVIIKLIFTGVWTKDSAAIDAAKFLTEKATEQSEPRIIDLVTTVIVYKFENLSRKEIQANALDLEINLT